jgi:hypothetical protein
MYGWTIGRKRGPQLLLLREEEEELKNYKVENAKVWASLHAFAITIINCTCNTNLLHYSI